MHVVMAIMLIAILLATVVFFWRTSEDFSQSYSESIDEKSFQNIATYIENTVAHNEIAWIERTLVQTNMVIPLAYDGQEYIGENEFFRIEYNTSKPNLLSLSSKDILAEIKDTKNVYLNTRFYLDGSYNIYSNPTIPALKDKNIIGDFFLYKIEPMVSGRSQEYIVHLTPTFKSAVIGDAGQPPESLAKSCFLLEYPKSYWSEYYNSGENTYSVYPSNYFIVNTKKNGIDNRYINYYTNIFIPSNSDMIESLSESPTKDILNDYIKSGGSLIMLSQSPTSKKKYDFLPINITFDKGKYDTIGVSKQHNITQNLEPYEIAGSYYSANATILDPFVDGPANEILLREVPYAPYLNNNPSLILSTWGAGKVVTTTVPIDIHSIVDNTFSVCPWWDPGELGNPPDWHFRKLVAVNSTTITRVNEPVKIIIDPTFDINKLAKEGFLDLEDTSINFDSIRVVELIGADPVRGICGNAIEISSQSYPFRPNLEESGYRAVPKEFHEHTIFFELEDSKDLRLEIEIPVGAQHKDEPFGSPYDINNRGSDTDFNITINDIPVRELLEHLSPLPAYPTNIPGYWDPYDGVSKGYAKYSVVLPQKYFHKGENKIRLKMSVPDNQIYTWYQNVIFRLYERRYPNEDVLFWQEYPPFYVYFSLGVSEQTQGISDSNTSPGQIRYYYIYFDIEKNGDKPTPDYREKLSSPIPKWSPQLDNQYAFKKPKYNDNYDIALDKYPIFMNVSSPSSADVDNNGIIDVLIGLRDGNVTAIKGSDGSILWKKPVVTINNPSRSGNTYYNYAGIAGSPTIGDINGDNDFEIVVGGATIQATFTRNNNRMEIDTLPSTVSILRGQDGLLLWSLEIDGALMSSPILADINQDGYKDIILIDTKIADLRYNANTKSFTNNPTITSTLYVFSGKEIFSGINPLDPRSLLLKHSVTVANPPYDARFFGRNVSGSLEFMIPNSSPAVGYFNGGGNLDSKGDGELDVVWGAIDGVVRVYFGKRNSSEIYYLNNSPDWSTSLGVPSVIPNPQMPLSYICSSPAIVQTDYKNDYEDIIISIVRTRNNQNFIDTVMLDGSNGTPISRPIITNANDPTRINSNANEIIGGHPVIHSPEGQSHRGPQVFVPVGSNIKVAHLDFTHIIKDEAINGGWGSIPQNNHTYATPAIVEINNYSTYVREDDSFFSDILIGNEAGDLYCHSYRDTDQNSQNAIVNNWKYAPLNPSPIRSSVIVDDINNDGRSEIVFMTFDGRLIALGAGNNYTRWNFNRHDLNGTANTLTNLNPISYTFSELEAIEFGNPTDPYDDKFRLLSKFTIGASNNFKTYMSEKWITIDTNRNNLFSDERVLYEKDLTKFNMNTYEGRPIETTYGIESIYGNIIDNNFIISFIDRGMIRLFNNIMAYTSAPTKNIQIEEGIWVNLDLPNTIGSREYIIEGTGTHLTIYDPYNADVKYIKELRGMSIYGTISSSSKNKYVVITSYGAYLSPNPQEG